MQVNNFIHYLNFPEKLSAVTEEEITHVVKEFPYCQTGQLMYAIQLNANNSILFEEQLKKAASICPDRTKLFEYIQLQKEITPLSKEVKEEIITQKKEEGVETKTEKDSVVADDKFVPVEGKDELDILEKEYLTAAISSTILLESDNAQEEIIEEKEVNLFDDSISHSFSSWLKHYSGQEQNADLKEEKELNQDIINKFIQEDPRIKPKKTVFYSPTNMARISVTDSGVVSETLALIHVDQGNYQEAINAYEKLSLKNPKKSSYFASQIKILKQKLK
ncbi:MAG: hypothetical protein COB15_07205 [Flavobacteriales bacterium]|nr:MAG: hypothetical protein COB15_07205 [Flavobacteriales bacterium]